MFSDAESHRKALSYLLLVLVPLMGCASGNRPVRADWVSERHIEHPLVGRIWEGRAGAFTTEDVLHEVLRKADFVLLGEVHDNPDHHRIQADLVRVAARDRHPVIAFEMIDTPLQAKVDAAGGDPEEIARAVGWEKSGWPEFALYRPIFEAARPAELKVVAANLSREEARAIVKQGMAAMSPELRAEVEKHWPPAPEVLAELREEMRVSHCGHFPEQMLEPMVLAQTARDVNLAQRMVGAAGPDGAILIAGNGHVRKSGVPEMLSTTAPGRSVVSVGVLEVDPGVRSPDELGDARGFDFVIFTPAKERPDPCDFAR